MYIIPFQKNFIHYEKANIHKLNKLIESENFKEFHHILKCYKKKYNKKNNMFKIHYVTDNLNKGFGRLHVYDKCGLQKFKKNIRNYLCNDYYIDCDISNCHPTIINYLLNQYNIKCKELDEYIKNRESCIEMYKFKKHEMYLCICNSNFKGNIFLENINKCIYNKLVYRIKYNFYKLWKNIQKNKYNKYIYEQTNNNNNNKDKNKNGIFIYNILEAYESFLLLYMKLFCDINNIKVGCFMYDGLLIDKEYTNFIDINHFFNNMSIFVYNNTGIYVNIKQKDMETYITL